MLGFKDFLDEEVNTQSLFHGRKTSAEKILKYDMLEGRTTQPRNPLFTAGRYDRYANQYNEVHGVSLTRSFNVAKDFGTVIFELDKTKLRTNHNIVPLQFFNNDKGLVSARTSLVNSKDGKFGRSTEYEEFLLGSIRNLSKYLIRIHLPVEMKGSLEHLIPSGVKVEYYH